VHYYEILTYEVPAIGLRECVRLSGEGNDVSAEITLPKSLCAKKKRQMTDSASEQVALLNALYTAVAGGRKRHGRN